MDHAYAETAQYYGFQCAGCEENCCLTRFYHHTHVEYFYLLSGFFKLGFDRQEEIRSQAGAVNRQILTGQSQGTPPRMMCALNEQGACLLYEYRPMICRLHGIPHELKMPGRPTVYGPGCSDFVSRCGDRGYKVFDRTPFYLSLSGLERRFREQFHITGKLKKTVSEMLTLESYFFR